MQAIIPHHPARSRPYAWGSISVDPDPPRVGEQATIVFPLHNPDPDEVVVKRIEVRVAQFGIGLAWEELGTIGPFRLPPDSGILRDATVMWTPRVGGHRCVRAYIHVAGMRQPLLVGRNLHVIQAREDEDVWYTPFLLGNPEPVAAPVALRLGGNNPRDLDAAVRIGGKRVPLDRPLWMEAGETVQAELELRAATEGALDHVRTLEASAHGRLIDGIEVLVQRPARLAASDQPEAGIHVAVDMVEEAELVYAR